MTKYLALLLSLLLVSGQAFATTGFSGGGGINSLSDIADLSCSDGQIIKWNNGSAVWECQNDAGAAAGDSVSIDSSAVVDPDFVSTGDIDFVDTSNTVTANLNAGVVAFGDIDYSAAIGSNPALAADDVYFGLSGTSGGIIFEGDTADTIESALVAVDPAASDKTWTLPNVTGTIITTGDTATVDATMMGADSVSASELNATGVEAELEAVMDLEDMQGAVTDAQVPDTLTASSYLPLAGGTMTGQITTDNLGIYFAESDTNPTCDTASAGQYYIYADLSETTLKKCVDGTPSDLDTGAGAWTDTTTTLSLTTSTDDVVIGNTTILNSGKFSVDGDADQVQATFQGNGTQTDSVVIVEASDGTEGATIEAGGLITTLVGLDAIGAVDMDYGSADVTDHTFTTDSTGDAEFVVPDDSIGLGEMLAQTQGDLLLYGASGAPAVLNIGTDNHTLMSNGTTAEWVALDFTPNLTFEVDSDGGGAEPAEGAGFTIQGGSGTDIDMVADATSNRLDFNGAVDGYQFDAMVYATGFTGSGSATPQMDFKDSDATAGDDNITLLGACTDVGNGTEDCDLALQVQEAGTLATRILIDADDGSLEVTAGATTGDGSVQLPAGSINGTEILDDTVVLTTDTAGNYVASLTDGAGISGGDGGSEAAGITLTVDQSFSPTWTGSHIYDEASGAFLEIPNNTTGTTAGDCDAAAEHGRIMADTNEAQGSKLKICGASGWENVDSGGAATAWDSIADPTSTGDVQFSELAHTLNWDSAATAAAYDGLSIQATHDSTTDSNSQSLLTVERLASSGTATFETLLEVNNLDTDGAVTSGLLITDSGGTMTTAIDATDAQITTALAIGSNTITTTSTTIAAAELDRLDGLAGTICTTDSVCTGYEGVLTNSAGLLAALSDETGTGVAVFDTSPTFSSAISISEATPQVGFDDSDGGDAVDARIDVDCPTAADCDLNFRVDGAGTEANPLRIDTTDAGAHTIQIGDGGTTNYLSIDETGDLTFQGSSEPLLDSGADADSATSSSDSGLEIVSNELTLLRGCSDNQVLVWDEVTNDNWNCEDQAGAGGDISDVGTACATGACYTDGVATSGTEWIVWEGSSVDTNEMRLAMGSANPTGDTTLTLPADTGTVVHDNGTALANGELLIGDNSGNPASATLTATAGEIAITEGAGSITIAIEAALDLGANTSVEIPNGAAPGTDAAGEIAVDTTTGQIQYHDGTAERALIAEHFRSMTLESPADADNFLMFKAPYALTITQIDCIVDPADSSESAVITVQETDANGDSPAGVDGATTITCANTSTADDGTLSNPTIDANDWVALDVGTVTGTVTQLSVTVGYRVDAD